MVKIHLRCQLTKSDYGRRTHGDVLQTLNMNALAILNKLHIPHWFPHATILIEVYFIFDFSYSDRTSDVNLIDISDILFWNSWVFIF